MIEWRWDRDGASLYDLFVDSVGTWNLYGLPALVIVVIAADLWRGSRSSGWWEGRARAVRRLGATHLFLAAWSVAWVAEEIGTYRSMGIFASNPITGFPGSLLAFLCDAVIGLGLVRLRPRSRRPAVALALVRLTTYAFWTYWEIRYGAAINPEQWPRLAASRVFPLFALLLLLLPGTRQVFRGEAAPPPLPSSRRDRWLAAVAMGFVVVAASATAADILDSLIRAGTEAG